MTPKPKYSKDLIIDSAFEIAREEGIDNITIRKVAKKMDASVAPIYVNFNDMVELKEAVIKKIYEVSRQFYLEHNTGNPFHDIGVASLKFAMEYPIIFRDLVMNYNHHMKNYDQEMSFLIEEMKNDPELEGLSAEALKSILLKMRVFQLGLSVMAVNGLLPENFTEEMMAELLENTAADVVYSTYHRK